jgi:hypothetical protein
MMAAVIATFRVAQQTGRCARFAAVTVAQGFHGGEAIGWAAVCGAREALRSRPGPAVRVIG